MVPATRNIVEFEIIAKTYLRIYETSMMELLGEFRWFLICLNYSIFKTFERGVRSETRKMLFHNANFFCEKRFF